MQAKTTKPSATPLLAPQLICHPPHDIVKNGLKNIAILGGLALGIALLSWSYD